MKKVGKQPQFNIFLLGPRRVGKTSILASMISSFKDIAYDTHIHIDPDNNTESLLQTSLIKLKSVHQSYRVHGLSRHFSMDEGASNDGNDYTFNITYDSAKGGSKKQLAQVVFKDRPGEWLTEADHEDDITELLSEADVLLVAIDSIQLMEQNGQFCESMHRTMTLSNYLANSDFMNSNMHKMVLFIPLKCERYYHDGRMDEVNKAVHQHFSKLIRMVTADAVKDRITVAITPILTMGGIEFESIGRNDKNEIPVVKNYSHSQLNNRIDPSYIFYRYYKTNPDFVPKYCEQPVLYTLYYIASLVNKQKKSSAPDVKNRMFLGGILFAAVFMALCIIASAMKDKNVEVSLSMLKSKIKRSGDGYEILNNQLNV